MPVIGHEEHVLRLEIGVGQLVVVHEPDRVAQLVGDVAHLLERVRHVRVALQEVKDGLAEDLEGEAHVAEVVEGVVHPNAEVLALRVLRVQLLEDVDLQLGGFPVLVDVLDDLATVWKEMKINPLSSAVHFDKFMTEKKTHEVAVLCDIIASLANRAPSQEHLILDLGCGRG